MSAGLVFAIQAIVGVSPATADETVTYTYNALGRVTDMSTSGGVANGVRQKFSYDSGGNLTFQQTFGPLSPRSVAISPTTTNVAAMGSSTRFAVTLSGASPGGSVTFRIDERYVGSAVINNGRASIRVTGLGPGTYTVTATYAGDISNDPVKYTYTVKVRDLSWLPAVLELMLH